MDSPFLSTFFHVLLFQAPGILVSLGGVVVALILWRRSALAAVLCLLALVGFLVMALAVPAIYGGLAVWSTHAREFAKTVAPVYTATHVVLNVVHALLLGVMLAAIYAGRSKLAR
jgi:hypothetical protein